MKEIEKKSRLRLDWLPEEDQIIQNTLLEDPNHPWVTLAQTLNATFHQNKKHRSAKQVKARWYDVIRPLMKYKPKGNQEVLLDAYLSKYQLQSRMLWIRLKEVFKELDFKQIKAIATRRASKRQKVVKQDSLSVLSRMLCDV